MGGWPERSQGQVLPSLVSRGKKTPGGCPAFSFRAGIVTDQYVAFRLVLLTVE